MTPEAAIASTVKQLGQPTVHWVYKEPGGFELMRVYRLILLPPRRNADRYIPMPGNGHPGDLPPASALPSPRAGRGRRWSM